MYPAALPIPFFFGMSSSSSIDFKGAPDSSFSKEARIPFVCPAPMTATFFIPGALYIFVARNVSRSSMRTSFTEGSSFATSFSIPSSVSWFFRSSSSSGDISSSENAADISVARSLHLFHKLLFAQALRKVVWISLSQRETGIPFSSASLAAPRISSPGLAPVCAPSFLWNDAKAVFARRRKPFPSLNTFLISVFSQLLLVFDAMRDASSSMQTLSGFSFSMILATSSTLFFDTCAVPTRNTSEPFEKVILWYVSLIFSMCIN